MILTTLTIVSCGRSTVYKYSLEEARKLERIPGETYFYEFGDANGPFRVEGGAQSLPGVGATFQTWVNGATIEWSAPVEEGTSFASGHFVNRSGNGFVVIYKIQENEPPSAP